MIGSNKVTGGVLLVSGTTIGAGMIALPVVTGITGFIPTLILFTLYWAYMTTTAFLILETDLWMKEDSNLVTMARNTLGRTGEAVCWAVYLLLLYLLTTAYLAGSGPVIADLIGAFLGRKLPDWAGALPLILLFGFIVFEGTRYVDYLNRLLMAGLLIAYVLIVAFLLPHVHPNLLLYRDWGAMAGASSIIATSFGFHIIIPTLTTYMHKDIHRLKKTILIGSVIPLTVYILWEIVALGIIPVTGEYGIAVGYREGMDAVALLTRMLPNGWLSQIARFFAFFAILTSFLGVTLSLSDFLADGLRIRKTYGGKAVLMLLTFCPPLIFIMTNARPFLAALEYAGIFGVIVLLGLMPPLMVWAGRYRKGYVSTFKVPGGKLLLAATILISFAAILIEIVRQGMW